MSSMLTSFTRWIEAHAKRFCDLPTVDIPSAAVTDDDTEAWGDLMYMRGLVDEIEGRATQTAANIAGPLVESMLARPVLDDQDGPDYPGVDVLKSLAAVRYCLDVWKRDQAWAFGEARHYLAHGGPNWVTA